MVSMLTSSVLDHGFKLRLSQTKDYKIGIWIKRQDIGGEWLLLNANSAIFQLYHGKYKLISNAMIIDDEVH
jgi:hypothetical protein